jgi:hypothetical protein
MQPAPAECQERKILQGRYEADLKVYLSAVRSLEQPFNPKEFRQAYQNADLAKRAFENARDALNAHLAIHGCGRSV